MQVCTKGHSEESFSVSTFCFMPLFQHIKISIPFKITVKRSKLVNPNISGTLRYESTVTLSQWEVMRAGEMGKSCFTYHNTTVPP